MSRLLDENLKKGFSNHKVYVHSISHKKYNGGNDQVNTDFNFNFNVCSCTVNNKGNSIIGDVASIQMFNILNCF